MLYATVLGGVNSPGLSYHSQDRSSSIPDCSHQQDLDENKSSALGRSIAPVRFSNDSEEDSAEEELVWYSRSVVWSRGAEIYRKYTYDHEREDVSRAIFVWFKTAVSQDEIIQKQGKDPTSSKKPRDTFGPFHRSQHSQWGAPRFLPAVQPTSVATLQRTLVVFLRTRAHVYFPSGEDIIVNLPFLIDGVWPLPQGGAILQRALERRELRREASGNEKALGGLLKGLHQTSFSILDNFVDLSEGLSPSMPRLFALESPFDELKVILAGVVQGGFCGSPAQLSSESSPLTSVVSVLYVSEEPYPFIVLHDRLREEVVVYRRTYVPLSLEPSPPTATTMTMRPEDLTRQPDPPSQLPPARPSLHRNPSSFASTKDRRPSVGADSLYRAQHRVPRLSRGAEREPIATGELQAALDHPPFMGTAMSASMQSRGRVRGLSIAARGSDTNRRISGTSSYIVRDVHDSPGKMALQFAAEGDLRETTMMMGLEREEERVRSVLVLDRIWSWKPPRCVMLINTC